ncbi:hypothetical protein [Paraclostridium bifermentans]|uniref:hypothetical protein n=1 Tax=Paraclostridium bifermentans TaxID=1490 RepID=UPI00387AC0DB
MFTIDFTKPWLYKDIIYFNQGNLSTNNTLRCKLITGGSDDFTGGSIACTFTTKDSVEISGFGKLVDAKNGIIDIVFPSNSLVIGANKLEVLVNRADGGIVQSPTISYDVWQGLTTGNGVESETNYPVLIELINQTNTASNTAKEALNKLNYMKVEMEEIIDFSYRAANNADIAASNANYKIDEVDEKIGDVNRALSAGTVDLELKEARKDASGFVHDTVKQRLDSDLIVGDKSLKDFVIDMNGMKESQDIAYETDTGYKVCQNTQNGVVKDLKIYGKTIKGLLESASKSSYTLNTTTRSKMFNLINPIPANTDIYIRVNVTAKKAPIDGLKINVLNDDDTVNYFEGVKGVYEQSLKIKHTKSIKKIGFYLSSAEFANDDTSNITFKESQVTLVDVGTTYIEGLASVGNGNEIEVLSRKENGNLFNINDFKGIITKLGASPNSFVVKDGRNCWMPIDYGIYHNGFKYYLNCKPNTQYKLKFDYFFETTASSHGLYFRVAYTDGTFGYPLRGAYNSWGVATLTTDINKTVDYIHMTYTDSNTKTWIDLDSIVMAESKYYNDKLENKQGKKTILFKDTNNTWKPLTELNGIDSNNCDMVDSTLNKYTKKYARYKFTGNETIDYITDYGDVSRFNVTNIPVYSKAQAKILCNKFNVGIISTPNIECINSHHEIKNIAIFQIKTNKLVTKDREGFKKWLVENPTEMIIEVEVPKVFDINPIYTESHDNETMFSLGSGAIAPHASWKITSSLPNFVKELSNQIKQLQEQVYKTNVANFAVALNTLDTKLRLDRLEAPQM